MHTQFFDSKAAVNHEVSVDPGWCVSNILVSLVEERECLRVEREGEIELR